MFINFINVHIWCTLYCSGEPCNMSVRGLFQAVRSQLHFSQLSAWWSSSKGTHPINVCYRVTLPGEAFASQFTRPPVHHIFPPAAVGPNTQLKVCSYLSQKSGQNCFISRLALSPGLFCRSKFVCRHCGFWPRVDHLLFLFSLWIY